VGGYSGPVRAGEIGFFQVHVLREFAVCRFVHFCDSARLLTVGRSARLMRCYALLLLEWSGGLPHLALSVIVVYRHLCLVRFRVVAWRQSVHSRTSLRNCRGEGRSREIYAPCEGTGSGHYEVSSLDAKSSNL